MTLPTLHPLSTPRLLLRSVRMDDLEDLLEVNADPEVNRFLPYPRWQSMDDARAWFDRMQSLCADGQAWQGVIQLRSTAQVVGSVLLFRHDAGSQRAELGYVLGRAHWGQGLMTEALRALCDAAFLPAHSPALRRLEAEVNPANTGSMAVLTRLGFVQEGLLRERWLNQGQPTDVVAWGALAREWPRAHSARAIKSFMISLVPP